MKWTGFSSYLHLVRLFLNQVFTWESVISSESATPLRSTVDKYFFLAKIFSNSDTCLLWKDVRAFLWYRFWPENTSSSKKKMEHFYVDESEQKNTNKTNAYLTMMRMDSKTLANSQSLRKTYSAAVLNSNSDNSCSSSSCQSSYCYARARAS